MIGKGIDGTSGMQRFEYKVIPAPSRGEKARGLKTSADRFAHSLAQIMNELGRDGWEYLRADTLPCEERTGLTGRSSTYHHLLVFRRPLDQNRAAESAPPAGRLPLLSLGRVARSFTAKPPAGTAPRLGPATAAAPASPEKPKNDDLAAE